MVQYLEKYKQNIAIDMRRKGFSYSEIENKMHIPKSTLSFWLKKIILTPEQSKKLSDRRSQVAKENGKRRKAKFLEELETIKDSSARDIKDISKKELWLMGIMLYWRERLLLENQSDIKNGVRFTSSDPYLIKLFLKWLKDVGNIEDNDILFDIFMSDDKADKINKTVDYWYDVTKFPRAGFSRFYFQKKYKNKISNKNPNLKRRKNYARTEFGMLRIRVKGSTLLARQIAGWMKGINRFYWGKSYN